MPVCGHIHTAEHNLILQGPNISTYIKLDTATTTLRPGKLLLIVCNLMDNSREGGAAVSKAAQGEESDVPKEDGAQ